MTSQTTSMRPPQTAFKIGLPVLVLFVLGGLLWQRVATMDITAITSAVAQVSLLQWFFATCATWCSFQAIGRYDAVWHRILQTGIAPDPARRAGMRAIAAAQTLGFGAITASLVRWRSLPSLSLWQATQLSLAVTVTFSLCWAAFAIGALWWLIDGGSAISIPPPVALIFLVAIVFFAPYLRGKYASQLGIGDIGKLLGLTALDLIFAGLALYILLPHGTPLGFADITAAYIIALGLGLIANTPGGAGAFDLALLALLPLDAPEPLVAAIIAFRIVYYLVPASFALAALAHPAQPKTDPTAGPAAWGLTCQSGELSGGWHIGWLPGVMLTIGAHPIQPENKIKISTLRNKAQWRARTTALYGCDPRMALAARDLGWHVRRTTMEAMIRPQTWSTTGGKRQTLRRKLRQAAQAEVTISKAGSDLPLAEMRQIANAWAVSRGGELGFSMGRFDPDYVRLQEVFLIKINAQPIGFVTFHKGVRDWSLDLIRHRDGIPEGSIHAAIVAGIAAAKVAGVSQLSLACVPDPRYTPAFWASRRAGLIQFKRCFGPIWVPRYHAAPSRFAFWFSALVIGIAIHRPLANVPWKCRRLLRQWGK